MPRVEGPKVPASRTTEREGIRAVTEFFETNGCIVQPVNLENDFGKDLYVDLTKDSTVLGLTCAVQVKSGASYRTRDGYVVPVSTHFHCWRDSTVPVLGIVRDPERGLLVWTDLT